MKNISGGSASDFNLCFFCKSYSFYLQVNDKGTPKLYSQTLANVFINVINVNDCRPEFTKKEINVTLYLPTHEGVRVTQITAVDMDTKDDSDIRYDIVDGNVYNTFDINNFTGEITLRYVIFKSNLIFEKVNTLNYMYKSLHNRHTYIQYRQV